MSLLFFDGFDHYSDAQRTSSGRWTASINNFFSGSITVTSAAARTGSQGLRVHGGAVVNNNNSNFEIVRKTLIAGNTGFSLGFAFRIPVSSNFFLDPIGICGIEDSTTPQVSMRIESDRTLAVGRSYGGGFVSLGRTILSIVLNHWYYFEFNGIIHPSTGMVDLHVDGQQWSLLSGGTPINGLTNQNTRATGNTSWNGFGVGLYGCNVPSNSVFGADMDFDDVVLMDTVDATATQGQAFNSPIGPYQVSTIYPTSDGNYGQFSSVPSSSAAHYTNLDEAQPNDDTDYNASATLNNRDSYNYIIPFGTVRALNPSPYARRDAGGARSISTFARISGVDYDNASSTVLQPTYGYSDYIMGVNPATSSQWVGGTREFGVKVTA